MIAYNYFMGQIRQLRATMDDFALEFLNLTERNFT
jgi:biopolymer transport protein ExbB/TolQ